MEQTSNTAASQQLSMAQRFFAESSPFFKVLGAIGAILMALATPAYSIPIIPVVVPVILTTAGACFLLAMFLETKVAVIIQNPNATLNDYLAIVPDLIKGLADVKQSTSTIMEALQNPAAAKAYVPTEVAQLATNIPAAATEGTAE